MTAAIAATRPDMEMARWRAKLTIVEWPADKLEWAHNRAKIDGIYVPSDGEVRHRAVPDGLKPLPFDIEHLALVGITPDAVREYDENVLATAGVTRILNLATTNGGAAWSATVGRILVGDGGGSAPSAAASDTDLVAAVNALNRYGQLFASAPTVSGTPASVNVSATFATGNGNFHWFEWAIDQGTASGATAATAPLMNHKGVDMGTKSSSVAWTANAQISIS